MGARKAQGGCREGDFGASLAHFGVGWGSLGALWGRSGYVKVTFVDFGLTLLTWWSSRRVYKRRFSENAHFPNGL